MSKAICSVSASVLFCCVFLFFGCGPKPPSWYHDPPRDNYLYGKGTAEGSFENAAEGAAKQIAKADLADKIETYVEVLTKLYIGDVRTNVAADAKQVFSQTIRSTTTRYLENWEEHKSNTYALKDGSYKAYVLIRVDGVALKEEAKARAEKEIRNNETLRAFEESRQAFEELDEYVERALREAQRRR